MPAAEYTRQFHHQAIEYMFGQPRKLCSLHEITQNRPRHTRPCCWMVARQRKDDEKQASEGITGTECSARQIQHGNTRRPTARLQEANTTHRRNVDNTRTRKMTHTSLPNEVTNVGGLAHHFTNKNDHERCEARVIKFESISDGDGRTRGKS
jgi:hypothetical protein